MYWIPRSFPNKVKYQILIILIGSSTFGFLAEDKLMINLGLLANMSCVLLKYCTMKWHMFLEIIESIYNSVNPQNANVKLLETIRETALYARKVECVFD